MTRPLRPETIHAVGRVFDNQPSVGKWETVIGEGGFGERELDFDMVGGDTERRVRRIVMEYVGRGGWSEEDFCEVSLVLGGGA